MQYLLMPIKKNHGYIICKGCKSSIFLKDTAPRQMLTSTIRVLNSFLKLHNSLCMRYMCHILATQAIITVHVPDFRGKFSQIHNELS